LPEAPAERVAGKLRFADDSGITLSLAGVLGEPSPSLWEKKHPIILGTTWDGPIAGALTLRDCQVKGRHLGSPGVMRETYFAARIFAGAHLESKEQFVFSSASVAFSGMSSWAYMYTGLRRNHLTAGGNAGIEISWRPPEPISGPIRGGHLTLGVGAKCDMLPREWSITEDVGLSIALDNPMSAEELSERYAYPLQNLLTLATDHPNSLLTFSVERPNVRGKIHVLAARTFHDFAVAADLLPYKMLFTLEDVKARAVELIARWLEVSDRLSDVCNPYFGIQYKPSSFVDIKFLVVFQSLEIYHRIRASDVQSREFIPGGLLDEMVRHLLEDHWNVAAPLFQNDLARAVSEIVSHRNYVVHRDSNLGRSETFGGDLYWLTLKLMCLMKACLMSELDISPMEQLTYFQRNQMYVHLRGLGVR
jgi:hypothetical protein